MTLYNQAPHTTIIDIEGTIGVAKHASSQGTKPGISTYEAFKKRVEEIERINSPKILVNIRSTGGSVQDALLIYESLVATGKEITTRCYGYVASAATIIAQAASTGRREMSENALYLIHKSVSTTEGNATNLTQTAELLRQTDERIASIYAHRSGRGCEEFLALMDQNGGNGKWLSAQEAQEMGLIDTVVRAPRLSNEIRSLWRQLAPHTETSTNPKNMNMTIKQHWQALLELLGIAQISPKNETSQTENLTENSTTDSNETLPEENLPMNELGREIKNLQARIISLESQNARLRAKATATLPKEDPSPSEEKFSANRSAYNEDILGFKS